MLGDPHQRPADSTPTGGCTNSPSLDLQSLALERASAEKKPAKWCGRDSVCITCPPPRSLHPNSPDHPLRQTRGGWPGAAARSPPGAGPEIPPPPPSDPECSEFNLLLSPLHTTLEVTPRPPLPPCYRQLRVNFCSFGPDTPRSTPRPRGRADHSDLSRLADSSRGSLGLASSIFLRPLPHRHAPRAPAFSRTALIEGGGGHRIFLSRFSLLC